MRLRDRRIIKPPELMIIPMIDIMFFLLVFFMLGTMYMIELKTIPIKLPTATNTTLEVKSTFSVTMKEDGSLWLEDKKIDLSNLLMQAKIEKNNNPNFAIIIRADKNIDYGKVVKLLDQIKGAGITRFGLATDSGV
ncbi:ExbD/TolR family protein [Succinispira mobilis]|uniref:ExbD/TolR family protein n=1 Tax=Succinispira mobilis TaxID=78120 RepID=UPI00036D10D5|nr:biopolymer transporter ExbD [Succinispira mobilis]